MNARVLYVEDNLNNVRLVRRVLEVRPNIDLLVATTALQGLDMAEELILNLILLDRKLPDLPGMEVLKRLKRSQSTRDIPVVVFSGNSAPDQVKEAIELGAVEFIPKPFELEHFLGIIDRFTEQ